MITRLYVGNLDYSTSEHVLIKLFSYYGKIVKFDYLYHKEGPKKGQFRGYCFVEYALAEEALTAIKRLDGKEINGRRMSVKKANDNRDQKSSLGQRQPKKDISTATKINALEQKLAELEAKKIESLKGDPERKMKTFSGMNVGKDGKTIRNQASKPYERPANRKSHDET